MRPRSDLVDRGWRAVDGVFNDWDDAVRHSKNGMLWVPMRKLMAKARSKRESDMQGSTVSTKSHRAASTAAPPALDQIGQAASGELKSISPIFSQENEFAIPAIVPSLFPMSQYGIASAGATDIRMGNFGSGQQHMQTQTHAQTLSQDIQSQSRPWILDDSALLDLDMSGVSGDGSLEGWEDLVSYFQMETDPNDPNVRGPPYGGMGYLM